MMEWAERSRERALVVHGHHKTTLKKKAFSRNALVGNGCQMNGFSKSKMTSRSDSLRDIETEEKNAVRVPTPDIFEDDPESYFKALNAQLTVGSIFSQMQNRRQSKWGGRNVGGGGGLLSKIKARMSIANQERAEGSAADEESVVSGAPPAATGLAGGLLARLRARRAAEEKEAAAGSEHPEPASSPPLKGSLLARLRAQKAEDSAKDEASARSPTPAAPAGGGLLARLRAKKAEENAPEAREGEVSKPANGGVLTKAPSRKKLVDNQAEPVENSASPEGNEKKARGGWLAAIDTADKLENEAKENKLPPLRNKKDRTNRAYKLRSVSNAGTTSLPDIKRNNKVARSQQDLRQAGSDQSSPRQKQNQPSRSSVEGKPPLSRGFMIKTPAPGDSSSKAPEMDAESTASTARKKRERSIKSAVRMAKARNADGSIPLPMSSQNHNPRPFYHIGLGEDVIEKTIQEWKAANQASGRERAIETLSKAQSFKERPWLGQIRQALLMTNKGVRRSILSSERSLMVRSVEGTADTGL